MVSLTALTSDSRVRLLQDPSRVIDGFFLFFSGSQEARVAKGGTSGAAVGAEGGVHNPSNRLPAGMLTNPVSFLIIPDLKTIQAHSGLRRGVNMWY